VIKWGRMRWAEHVSSTGETKNAYFFIGKPERKRTSKTRRKWKDNIRLDLREIQWEGVKWMYLTQSRDQ